MNIKKIFEEYDDTFNAFINGRKVKINIFKNPSKSEMKAISKTINGKLTLKFFANGKDLYVFSPLAFHLNIIKYLGFNALNDYPQGVAIFDKGEWKADKTDKSYYTLKKFKNKKIIV